MKSRSAFFVLFLLFFSIDSYCQDIKGNSPKIFYRNEKVVGLQLNTNGFGLGYRYGSRINYFEKKLYEIDISLIKHPKEYKTSSTFLGSESFIFGKLNYVLDIRLGYGKQKEIYSKRDPGSVAVRYFYSFGPEIAFQKPIYYKILYPVNDSVYGVKEERFNPDIHTSGDINGKSSFFKGIDEIKVIPGAYFKLGFNFEFSQSETFVHALEAGGMVQIFAKSLDIMAVDDNQQFYFTLFVCYRFGKITNAQDISEDYLKKRKKKFRIFNLL